MNRLIVAFLAALDAVLAAAGGIVLALAPLTLLWVVGFGATADWASLWPASAALWQAGHLVPLAIQLPEDYLLASGIDLGASSFVLSLAPLVFALFTAGFAARSGGRAAAAGTPVTGVATGAVVFSVIATGVALTSTAPLLGVELWQAIAFPALVFVVPCLLGAAIGAWRERVEPLASLRARVERLHDGWQMVPDLIVRGTAVALAGLSAIGGVVLALAVLIGGAQIVALFQAGNVDLVGATVIALGQLVYLPTLVVWALSFAAGPGFALGTGTAVSPAGTQLGVVPGIPVLGAVPDSTSTWMLLLVLLPVAVGAATGWVLRSRFAAAGADEEWAPRLTVLGGVSVLTAGIAALLAVCASGSLGPGRLAEVGPDPGALALAVGVEVGVGAAILLLAPRRHDDEFGDIADAEAVTSVAAHPERFPALAGVLAADHFDEPRAPNAWAPAEVAPPAPWPSRAADADDTAPIGDAPEPAAAPEPDPAEQATEPIIGFERGSSRPRPPRDETDTPVD